MFKMVGQDEQLREREMSSPPSNNLIKVATLSVKEKTGKGKRKKTETIYVAKRPLQRGRSRKGKKKKKKKKKKVTDVAGRILARDDFQQMTAVPSKRSSLC